MKAPDFCLKDSNELKHCLKDYLGKWVIAYFYPKDNTPGCTLEAIDFSKHKSEFEKNNAVILGISRDSCKAHQEFVDKHGLTIVLLSDPDGATHKAYGVLEDSKLFGTVTKRSTFIINKKGEIVKEWRGVNVIGHARMVLNELIKFL